MNTGKYTALIPVLEKYREIWKHAIIEVTKEISFFSGFASPGIQPTEVVTETFLPLLELSVKSGNMESLTQQYVWTAGLLEARGMPKVDFIAGFTAYLDQVKAAAKAVPFSPEEKELLRQLIDEIKAHFHLAVKG